MKKVLALLMAVLMLVSLFAGCASTTTEEPTNDAEPSVSDTPAKDEDNTADDNTDKVDETIDGELPVDYFAGTELNIAILRKTADESGDPNEKEIFKRAEEATGIHVNFTTVDEGAVADKLGVMLAGSEQPDVYMGLIDASTLAGNRELFYNLAEGDLLQTYAPNVCEAYDSVSVAWDAITWSDGSIYSLITGTGVSGTTDGSASLLQINQNWLDNLNLEVPTTADELYDVLVAFRDNDADGDGDPNNEIPMTLCAGNWQGAIMMMANAFGIGYGPTWQDFQSYYYLEDGVVHSTIDSDNFRAFLEFFNKLYSEGLLDAECFTQTADQYNAKTAEQIAGVFLNFSINDNYTPFMYQGIEGVEPSVTGIMGRFTGQRTNFVVSAGTENVEAILHWWNYLSSTTELRRLAGGQVLDVNFSIDDEGNAYLIENNANSATDGIGNMGPMTTAADVYVNAYDNAAEGVAKRVAFINEHIDWFIKDEMPTRFASAEAEEERAFIEIDLYDYISSFIATAISQGVTDASWTQHLSDLESVGYYEWIQWYQDYVDGVL